MEQPERPEATASDLIRYAAGIGEIERAAETIAPLLPVLRVRESKRVLDGENEPATARRPGLVMEAEGFKKPADAVHDCLPDRLETLPLSPIQGEHKSIPPTERRQVLYNSSELNF